ncbi:GAF domain-containing protein [Streptosporangium fragile]|uniref:GAF domain-containing protein n=1 Tax=Streptosporangium fragile TaxID=46186 RepID=UPI0031EA4A6E
MYGERAERVRAAINERALAEELPVSLRHVCLACADSLNVSGGCVMLASTLGLGEPVYATDLCSDRLAELQITMGEGPTAEALREDRAVLVPDLAATGTRHRWPLFVPQAQDLGRRAVFSFPLLLGATAVGVLEVNRADPG